MGCTVRSETPQSVSLLSWISFPIKEGPLLEGVLGGMHQNEKDTESTTYSTAARNMAAGKASPHAE